MCNPFRTQGSNSDVAGRLMTRHSKDWCSAFGARRGYSCASDCRKLVRAAESEVSLLPLFAVFLPLSVQTCMGIWLNH